MEERIVETGRHLFDPSPVQFGDIHFNRDGEFVLRSVLMTVFLVHGALSFSPLLSSPNSAPTQSM